MKKVTEPGLQPYTNFTAVQPLYHCTIEPQKSELLKICSCKQEQHHSNTKLCYNMMSSVNILKNMRINLNLFAPTDNELTGLNRKKTKLKCDMQLGKLK